MKTPIGDKGWDAINFMTEQSTLTPIPIPNVAKFWSEGSKRMAGPFYHATHTGNLDSIMREGLKPSNMVNAENRIWDGSMSSRYPGVYLSRDAKYADEVINLGREVGSVPDNVNNVLLKIKQLPTNKFMPDEDIYEHAMHGLPDDLRWIHSFLSSPDSKMESIGKKIDYGNRRLFNNFIDEYNLNRPTNQHLSKTTGMDSFSYGDIIPPNQLEVLSTGNLKSHADVIGNEHQKYIDLLRNARKTDNVPWWAK